MRVIPENFPETIDRLLGLLHTTDKQFRTGDDTNRTHILPLNYFSGAEPLIDEFYKDNNEGRYFTDVTPEDVDFHWDVSTLTTALKEDEDERHLYQLTRNHNLKLSDVRGQRCYSSIVNEAGIAHLFPGGRYLSAKRIGWYVNGVWRIEDHAFIEGRMDGCAFSDKRVSGLSAELDNMVAIALAVEFNRFYEWRVQLGYDAGLELSFVTDPIGAQEAFRLRDIPNGAGRRAALRNWVTEHWRQVRSEPEEETKVRRHLRGATRFSWNGLACTITPSRDDIQLNEKLKRERARERQAARRAARKSAGSQVAAGGQVA